MQKPLITALTTLLLASCATTPTPQATQTARPDSIITIPTTTATSNATLEQQYGGTIALRTNTFAIIANPTRQPLTAQGGKQHSVEKNKDAVSINNDEQPSSIWGNGTVGIWGNGTVGIWGNGTVGIWGNGTVGIWGNGSSTAWNEDTYLAMPENTQIWNRLGLKRSYETSRLGTNKIVAVVDSGIDLSHPIFTSSLAPNDSWMDFVDGDPTPSDDGVQGQGSYGHGTAVAGIIRQIAPNAKIMPLRVMNSSGNGDALSVAHAIVWATDHGADVINLSLGTDSKIDSIHYAIQYAENNNVVVVAAAGNTNKPAIDYPANELNDGLGLSIGSINTEDQKSIFSSYSDKISLMTYGEGITTSYPEGRVINFSGTSASAPIASAAIAIGLGEGKTPVETLKIIKDSARDVRTANPNYDKYVGSGALDLEKYALKLRD
ncbi:S8 family serine peptidase [Deinococcus aquaticus]|uniref:S8 family serine peptidase n=1 Tax=Deinococcus aquaticus TaxID=328692 RepID=UPI003F48452F